MLEVHKFVPFLKAGYLRLPLVFCNVLFRCLLCAFTVLLIGELLMPIIGLS